MIFDSVAHAAQYRGISPALDAALELLSSADLSALAPGRYEVSDDLYYNVSQPTVRPCAETKWECHRDWIDVQYIPTPGELIAVCPAEDVADWTPYDAAGDCRLSDADADALRLPMDAGVFAVFFPGDAHRPCIARAEERQVRKIVLKVRV